LVIASAASIAGTKPRVSIMPNAIPLLSAIFQLLSEQKKETKLTRKSGHWNAPLIIPCDITLPIDQ
jgi:hypothetical protein